MEQSDCRHFEGTLHLLHISSELFVPEVGADIYIDPVAVERLAHRPAEVKVFVENSAATQIP